MKIKNIIGAITCRLGHTSAWEKRGKGMKDNLRCRGRKTYTYWCALCDETRITHRRVLPRDRAGITASRRSDSAL